MPSGLWGQIPCDLGPFFGGGPNLLPPDKPPWLNSKLNFWGWIVLGFAGLTAAFGFTHGGRVPSGHSRGPLSSLCFNSIFFGFASFIKALPSGEFGFKVLLVGSGLYWLPM